MIIKMGLMRLNIFILFLFYNYIKSKVEDDCQVGNYCGSEKYACSINGNCNFNIYKYFKLNNTEDDKQPHCVCNMGYSSFDIENLKSETNILCCYKQKSQLKAFLLELFLGFGIGHFYLGKYYIGGLKLGLQLSICVTIWCIIYFACNREYSIELHPNEINNDNSKNILNENKNDNYVIDENGNEEDDSKEANNNEQKNHSFYLNENNNDNKEYEEKIRNAKKCPKSRFFIYLSIVLYFIFTVGDIICLGFGFYKDGYGENLFMWY